ncbi:hypothetical protein C0995_009680 [Termitomyces sp. Mi166|nr:hypothetical protein C0995_009680 [Termitomyces sp. Mi166\
MAPSISTVMLWAAVTVNLGILILNVQRIFQNRELGLRTYTYMGDDFPLEYPIGPLEEIATTLHETVRLQIYDEDPSATQEWQLLEKLPKGYGRVRLGPDHRLFLITMFHQFHCLRAIELRLHDRNTSDIDSEHYGHCLNYLRQTLLCDANYSLEEGDFMEKDLENDRVGSTMICRDWEKVYAAMNENNDKFEAWAKKWN